MKAERRILVVDDDPGIGQMLTRALERHGFGVDATTSADEALEMAGRTSYDAALVLSDAFRARGVPVAIGGVFATLEPERARAMVEQRDAALVDLVMPGRDGADLAQSLRRLLPGLPIGLLTGYGNSPLIPTFERSGMAVFKKPILIQELVEFLQREIGGQ